MYRNRKRKFEHVRTMRHPCAASREFELTVDFDYSAYVSCVNSAIEMANCMYAKPCSLCNSLIHTQEHRTKFLECAPFMFTVPGPL